MMTATKASIMDISLKSTKTNLSSKTISKYETLKSEDFKKALNSKINSKDADTQKVYEVNENETSTETKDATKIDELKENLKKLEKDSKSDSTDKVNDILTELLNLLTKLGIREDLKSNGEASQAMSGGINGDTNLLKSMEKLLNNLSANLAGDNTTGTNDIKSSIKNLMSEISNMLDNKQSQNGKVLTVEDMLNKNYSQDNKESSTEKENNNATISKDSKEVSKEDKFLNSLIDDDKDSSLNKINLFASRTQAIQNQGVNTVRGLTIDKATFSDDLIKDVKYMSNNGLKELTIKVNPGNIGEITIKLVQEDGLMKANLKASSKETSDLLSQNLTDIKKQLSEQNIKIADVNIELYKDDTTFFSGEGFNGQFAQEQRKNSNRINNENGEISIEDNLIENMKTINNGNVNFLA